MRFAVGRSWRVDETYVKIRGEWCYLYRAVDRVGRTVDFRLSARRDVIAGKAFFRKAIKNQRPPQTITLGGYAASHRAVRELKADGSLAADTKQRSSKYLNSLIEQDHRSVKQRIAVMLGLKQFRHAAITIAGIELMHCIRGAVRVTTCRCPRPSCARSLERGARGMNVARCIKDAHARAHDLHRNPFAADRRITRRAVDAPCRPLRVGVRVLFRLKSGVAHCSFARIEDEV